VLFRGHCTVWHARLQGCQYAGGSRQPDEDNKIYKNFFYKLVVTLLTVSVTTTTCERSHSKVAFVKSAVRSSMTSHRFNDLVMISCCEKSIIDSMDLSYVVDRFAMAPRDLPPVD